MYLYRLCQSSPIRFVTMARTIEARFLEYTHGRIKNRALFTTRCRFACRLSSDHPMYQSLGATRHAQEPKPRRARRSFPEYTKYFN